MAYYLEDNTFAFFALFCHVPCMLTKTHQQFVFFRTVAIDMRGYGESDKPVGVSEYYIGKLILDVKETIEYFGNMSLNKSLC